MTHAPLERRRGHRRNIEPKRPTVLTCSKLPSGRLPHGGLQVGVGLGGGERARHLIIVMSAVVTAASVTMMSAVAVMMAAASVPTMAAASVPMVPFPVLLCPMDVGPPGEMDEDLFVALGLVHAQQDVAGDGRARVVNLASRLLDENDAQVRHDERGSARLDERGRTTRGSEARARARPRTGSWRGDYVVHSAVL